MQTTRRSYLAAAGGTFTLGTVSGCLGGSNSSLPEGCDVGSLDSVSSLPRPALGPDDASVTVDVFEDFACPHCQTFSLEVFPRIRSNYIEPGSIRYRFFDFPIPVDETWSWKAASAARAVQDQSDVETFFAFTKGVFENQGRLGEEGYQVVHDVANDLDVDGCRVAAAAKQEPYRPVVEADRQEGMDREVPGTPAVYVDGLRTDGYGWDAVQSLIDSQLDDD